MGTHKEVKLTDINSYLSNTKNYIINESHNNPDTNLSVLIITRNDLSTEPNDLIGLPPEQVYAINSVSGLISSANIKS